MAEKENGTTEFNPPPLYPETFKLFGIEFAPRLIPLERRMQTVATLWWLLSLMFGWLITSILMAVLFFWTRFWYVPVAYLTWMVYDLDTCNRGGRTGWSVDFVRGWRIWKHYRNFFPVKLIKTAELDRNQNYLLGSHPHGVLCSGAVACFGTDGAGFSTLFPGILPHLLTIEGLYWMPGFREMVYGAGGCAATKRGMEALLGKPGGHATVLVVGGAPESLNSDKDKIKLIINRRKGFIKLALRFGVDLVPSFSFGETSIYKLVPNPEGSMIRRVQDYLQNAVGFAPVLFTGRGIFQYNFGIVPRRKPLTVVVGAPINVEKVANPSVEEIANLHAKYVEELEALYNKYNPVYGDTNVELVIT